MARFIDADALIEAIKHELWDWQTLDGITSTCVLKQTITDVQNAPTVDVGEMFTNELTKRISERLIRALEENYEIIPKKPVVRCKDCKHLVRSEGVCKVLSNNYEPPVYVDDDDFCSRGERREMEGSGTLEEVTSADVDERKKGVWEMEWHSFFGIDVPRCSVCHKLAAGRTEVCPNCGARMEENDAEIH